MPLPPSLAVLGHVPLAVPLIDMVVGPCEQLMVHPPPPALEVQTKPFSERVPQRQMVVPDMLAVQHTPPAPPDDEHPTTTANTAATTPSIAPKPRMT